LKLELEQADIQSIVQALTAEVVKALKPLVNSKGEGDIVFTVKTLAKSLEVSEKWIYERVQFKEIPYFKLGGNVRFSKKDIDRWIETQKTPAVNPLSRPLKAIK